MIFKEVQELKKKKKQKQKQNKTKQNKQTNKLSLYNREIL